MDGRWIHISSATPFERIEESLGGCQEAEAFSWGHVVLQDNVIDVLLRCFCDVGFTWQLAAYPSDGIFDTAFLPW